MKRKAFIALLAASMVLGVCTPAFAAEDIEVESATPVEAENQASKVVVAVDDDSFTIGPWGSDSAVRDWTEDIIWAHLCYRPFIGAMLENDELQMNAAKSVTKVDDSTYDVEIFDNIVDNQLYTAITNWLSLVLYLKFHCTMTVQRQLVITP